MPISQPYSDYDPLAWFYNRHWGAEYHRHVWPIVERLVLSRLPPAAGILDLCCGCGRTCAALVARGFRVTGLDGSGRMLEYARQNAPQADFLLADARDFNLNARFDVVISLFESLNHIPAADDLLPVFANVSRALRPGGVFFFDLQGEPAFQQYWNCHHAIVEDDNVCICRSHYDAGQQWGTAEITLFRRDPSWSRSDLTLRQRYHPFDRVCPLLERAGLRVVAAYDATQDFGVPEEFGLSRRFFLCRHAPVSTEADDRQSDPARILLHN